jgi:hypothetical protein
MKYPDKWKDTSSQQCLYIPLDKHEILCVRCAFLLVFLFPNLLLGRDQSEKWTTWKIWQVGKEIEE